MRKSLFALALLTLAGAATSQVEIVTAKNRVKVVRSVEADYKQRVADLLRDPDSAQFRKVRFYEDPESRGVMMCAEVNGKNAYGGYVGYKSAIVIAGRPMIELEDQAVVRQMCTEH